MKRKVIASSLICCILFSMTSNGGINLDTIRSYEKENDLYLATPSAPKEIKNENILDDELEEDIFSSTYSQSSFQEYEYEIEDNKAILTNYISDSFETTIEIPNEIDGYTVIGLRSTFKNNQRIKKIVIPNGIEFLGEYTFYQCGSLKTLELPNTLISIGERCFESSGITEISIPSSVNNIERYAFRKCENLQTADLGETDVEELHESFYGCYDLQNVTLPSNLKILGESSFSSCSSLQTVVIPETVAEIGYHCFSFCDSLRDIRLPSNLKFIGFQSFVSCNSLEELVIPEGNLEIEMNGFTFISGNNLKRIVNNSNNDYHKELYDGSKFYTWYTTETGNEIAEYLPAHSTIYRRQNNQDTNNPDNPDHPYAPSESGKYVQTILNSIPKTISMEEINTRSDALNYTKDYFSDNLINVYNLDISTTKFVSATAGTSSKPEGENGSYRISIWAKDTQEYYFKDIQIIATKYQSSSSSGSSSGGSGSGGGGGSSSQNSHSVSSGLVIYKPNVVSGTWENDGSRWKLKLENGSYANSQWAFLNNKWYLFDKNGYMLAGWQKVNNKWYLLAQNGDMLSGWQNVDGKRYYMEPSGEMTIGWKWIGNKCYYLGTDGAMLVGTTTPDGYAVNENGEWVQ